jgi:hypothetical protein
MRKFGHYLMAVTGICAVVLIFTPTTLSDRVGGPKRFEGELQGHTYIGIQVVFKSDTSAEFKVDFAPKYQRNRSESECRNFELKLYNDKGEWIQTMTGSYSYVEDKQQQKEVIRCRAFVRYSLRNHRDEMFEARLVNKNPWLAVYVLSTN